MKPGPDDALSLAREQFLLPERVDMSTLADELGVNRVTLYRWFGSRDRLLVEVVWSLAAGHAVRGGALDARPRQRPDRPGGRQVPRTP